jgi:5'-deoxynucleotidase YfbR-like HD superfamily hydrolase
VDKETSIIQTYSGIAFDILNPTPETILVPDIAHSLSMLCRFTGHSRKFYSVAQHSILCYKLLPDDMEYLRLPALLHDAQEAYIQDLSTPLKRLFPRYKKIEDTLAGAIAKRFHLEEEDFKLVKVYDRMALEIESKALLGPRHPIWSEYQTEFPSGYDLDYALLQVEPMTPEEAEAEFLKVFNKLWLDRL